MMKETNNMALVTSKVVVKMNKLKEKLDQQVAVLNASRKASDCTTWKGRMRRRDRRVKLVISTSGWLLKSTTTRSRVGRSSSSYAS
jgi:hypothetical protein